MTLPFSTIAVLGIRTTRLVHRRSIKNVESLIHSGNFIRKKLSPQSFSSRQISNTVAKATGFSLKDSTKSPSLLTKESLVQETNRLLNAVRIDSPAEEARLADFDKVMAAWIELACKADSSNNNKFEAALQTHSLLQALQENASSLLAPNTASLNYVLQAYAVSGSVEAAERAEALLFEMMNLCQAYLKEDSSVRAILPTAPPSERSFNIVLNAWAKSGAEDAGDRAEQVFFQMEEWFLECNSSNNSPFRMEPPNAKSLTAVLEAWSHSGAVGAIERVRVVLEHTIRKLTKGPTETQDTPQETIIMPDTALFNSVIHALVLSHNGIRAAEQAEEILDEMIKLNETIEWEEHDEDEMRLVPNTRTYSLILNAWAEAESEIGDGSAARRAESILQRMETSYRHGHKVKPNDIAFTTCIKAWSKCKCHDAAERAELLLDQMIGLYKETQDDDFRPTPSSGNAVILAWANSPHPHSAGRAEKLLEKSEDFFEPDVYSYNTVIRAFAKKGNATRALYILKQMTRSQKEGGSLPSPDAVSYNTVIDALAKNPGVGIAEKAENLLQQMERLSDQGMEQVKPSLISYTSAIYAWSKSMEPTQAEKAHALLMRMVDRYRKGDMALKPEGYVCTAVISACANLHASPVQMRNALKIALSTFEEMKQSPDYENPNDFTYAAIMRACSKLSASNKERSRLIEEIFRQCCQDGLVSKRVISMFRQSAPEGVQAKFFSKEPQIPPAWTSNVWTSNVKQHHHERGS